MNTLAFWDQAEMVEFYECLPGPPLLYIPCSAQGDGLRPLSLNLCILCHLTSCQPYHHYH